jgi:hypothetical protein
MDLKADLSDEDLNKYNFINYPAELMYLEDVGVRLQFPWKTHIIRVVHVILILPLLNLKFMTLISSRNL